jgi:hypothetical protein
VFNLKKGDKSNKILATDYTIRFCSDFIGLIPFFCSIHTAVRIAKAIPIAAISRIIVVIHRAGLAGEKYRASPSQNDPWK